MNNGEITIIQSIVNAIKDRLLDEDACPISIGIIALYAAQQWALNKRIQHPAIQISTVDAFQGNEKDLIFVSTVRSNGIGFTADPRRLNVAITRAKSQLVIIGNKQCLSSSPLWCTIFDYIRQNGRIVDSSELPSLY